eukprot:jgi/Picre1/31100/NNA_006455.t1
MNALTCNTKPSVTGRLASSRARTVCKAQPKQYILADVIDGVKQAALIATAAGALSLAQTDAVFAVAKQNTAYEEQLLSAIKSRTGKDDILPSLTASPKVEAPKETKKVETPAPVPQKPVAETPRPSIDGKEAPANAPTIKGFDAAPAAPAPQKASAPAAKAVESEGSDNKNAIVLGGIVLVAVAGVAAAGGGNSEEGSSPAAAPAAGGSSSDVPPNVAEARAWIAAWKKKHGKA